MKIAYLVLAHKEFDLLEKLINSLNHPNIDIILHFDSKSEINTEELATKIHNNDNVYYLDERINITWGGFSILSAQLSLLKAAISIDKYDYLSFLSGQDFPIKRNDFVLDFLNFHKGYEFIEHFKLSSQSQWAGNGGLDRFEYYWLIDQLGYAQSVNFYQKQRKEGSRRHLPNDLVPFGGSNWITITKSCAEYIQLYVEKNPEILDFFRLVAHPEEIFFHTIVLNSIFVKKTINNNLRYIDWKSGVDKPKILGIEDLNNLQNSSDHFARKFDLSRDAEIVKIIQSRFIN